MKNNNNKEEISKKAVDADPTFEEQLESANKSLKEEYEDMEQWDEGMYTDEPNELLFNIDALIMYIGDILEERNNSDKEEAFLYALYDGLWWFYKVISDIVKRFEKTSDFREEKDKRKAYKMDAFCKSMGYKSTEEADFDPDCMMDIEATIDVLREAYCESDEIMSMIKIFHTWFKALFSTIRYV